MSCTNCNMHSNQMSPCRCSNQARMNNMYRGRNQMSVNMNQPCSSCRNAGPNKKDDKHDKEMNSCPCHKDGCDIGTDHVDKMNPAMAFVPWQKWGELFDMCDAFECGTIFKDLNKPWRGRNEE